MTEVGVIPPIGRCEAPDTEASTGDPSSARATFRDLDYLTICPLATRVSFPADTVPVFWLLIHQNAEPFGATK